MSGEQHHNSHPDNGRSALETAAAIRSGERTAVEVVDAALASIAATEPHVGAYNLVLEERAREAAAEIDRRIAAGESVGPLAGVPIAIKDNICTRGVETTCSSKILEGWKPPYDATVMNRLAAAGTVMVGKTNMDEFAMGSSTENSAFATTRNPHRLDRVPGGSSGGSAATVAAGNVTISLGSDTGGSIRQPAGFCGVVGVKPTYGTVSRFGLVAYASSLDQIGPFATNVADAAALLEAIAGHDTNDSTSIPQAFPKLGEHLGDGVAGLRVGLPKEFLGEGIAADVRARVVAAAEALAAAGATVEETTVPAAAYALSAYYILAPAEASSNLSRFDGVRFGLRVDAATTPEMYDLSRSAGFGAEVKNRIMLGTYALSAGYYDAYYGTAQKVRTLVMRDFDAAYQHFDVLLTPTSPTTAFGIGANTDDPMTMYMNDICTIPTNLAGHPAMSVPFGAGEDGLPIGVQVLAPALGEIAMFRAAAVLEAAAPARMIPALAEVTR
ncbi:MAG: Asp-tRNA(Asn)/Glu-tRNA(Gln) amidotransferase subunit GatA [Actinobacteria bacterium]|nr:Asp-tRNA(Asn)/Glu-tRNA(Gln) amidotransferase subunit GatA [Actinomycetota bacterium]